MIRELVAATGAALVIALVIYGGLIGLALLVVHGLDVWAHL